MCYEIQEETHCLTLEYFKQLNEISMLDEEVEACVYDSEGIQLA